MILPQEHVPVSQVGKDLNVQTLVLLALGDLTVLIAASVDQETPAMQSLVNAKHVKMGNEETCARVDVLSIGGDPTVSSLVYVTMVELVTEQQVFVSVHQDIKVPHAKTAAQKVLTAVSVSNSACANKEQCVTMRPVHVSAPLVIKAPIASQNVKKENLVLDVY